MAAAAAAARAAAEAARLAGDTGRAGRGGDSAVAVAGRGRGRGRGGIVVPPTPFASFPVPGSVPVVFHPTAGGTSIANLALTGATSGTDKLVDDVSKSGSMYAMMDQSQSRLLYATPTFTDTVHISGTPRVTLRIASSAPAANLSVWLVMLRSERIIGP